MLVAVPCSTWQSASAMCWRQHQGGALAREGEGGVGRHDRGVQESGTVRERTRLEPRRDGGRIDELSVMSAPPGPVDREQKRREAVGPYHRARMTLAARQQATERIVDRKPADNDLCDR